MRAIVMVALILFLSACASPPQSLEMAPASSPEPAQVKGDADAFTGQRVVWGGRIASVTNAPDATFVSVLAKPLDGRRRPKPDAEGGTRFMARLEGFRDPMVFRRDRLITVVGKLEGTREVKVGDYPYRHPVVAVTAHELWQGWPERAPQRDRFYRYDYFHDPFIFGSPWPARRLHRW